MSSPVTPRVRSGIARLALAAAALAGLAAAGAAAAAPPFALEFGGPGTPAPGALGSVGGDVAVDSEGNVWVEDVTENRVVKYDYNGSFVAELTQPEGLAAPFADLNGLGADDAGGVYAVDGGSRVVKMDVGGRHVRTYGAGAGLSSASDVAVGADGVVHVLEAGRIARFRQDGTAIADVALPPTVADGRDLALAPSGDYYVNNASRIVRLSPAGAVLNGVAVFAAGEGLAVDASQTAPRVYGKTGLEGVVQEYTPDLTSIGNLSSEAQGPARVSTPTGIDSDCRGTVYVVDRAPAGSRVVKFDDPSTPPPPCAPPPPLAGAVGTQINDIDVTQGVQWDRDYTATDAPAGPRGRVFAQTPGVTAPTEVPMRAGGKTVVRVYANLLSGPPGGIANIPMTLAGATSAGRPLGTIQPDAVPPVLRPGDARVDPAERIDRSSAYTFTLPDEWTAYGRLDLTARVNPAGIGCDDACRRRSTFRLTRIPFQQPAATCLIAGVSCSVSPAAVDVWPLSLRVDGRDPARDPKRAFDVARATTPVELSVWGWMAQIDVTDVVRATSITTESCFLGIDLGILCSEETGPLSREVREGMLFERIERFKADRKIGSSTVVMGLIGDVHPDLPGANRGKIGDEPVREVTRGPRGYANVARPLTAVTHELHHALGRRHAGRAPDCYPDAKQLGEPWPDFGDRGNLFGFGLDTRARSGGAIGPYRLFAPSGLFDLMSYCGGEGNTWISTVGWNRLIGYRAPGFAVPNSVEAGARAMATGRLIRVTAVELSDGRLRISGTSPGRGVPPAADPAARHQLEARDAAGAILASAPMSAETAGDGPTLLAGAVAAPAGTAQVVVRRGTETATRRRRSASAPTVRLRLPRPGARVSGRAMVVAWRAADRDRDRVVATVELSLDGGRSYRAVHIGPSSGRVRVPASLLGDSRNARVRVRVDDGFNEAEARSGRVTLVGAPPALRVVSPLRGQRVRAGAPLRLEAEGTAAGGRPLGSRAFRWREGRRDLGRGSTRTVSGLRAGRHVIRVTASDGRRSSTVAVPVRVTAVRPAFLRLDAPARLARGARSARLRVASTVPATLLVGGRRHAVDTRPRGVVVRVRPGTTPLRLTLRLRSGALQTRVPLTVERG
jgi:hypothetical protein